jgi:hypothetical protein
MVTRLKKNKNWKQLYGKRMDELTKCGKFGTEQKSITGWDVTHTKISEQ